MDRTLIARASININVPSEQVWNALVNPRAIRQYMFGAQVVSDWREGSPIVWKGEWRGKPYEDKGVILHFRPGRTLQYSHFSPLAGLPDKPENYHLVTIQLSADGDLTHISLAQDNNANEEARAHSEKNWGTMLAALKEFLEQPGAQAQPPAHQPNPVLERLGVFVGEWEVRSPQYSGALGRAAFEWLEGGAFLVQHLGAAATMIIGRDDSTETYCMLYFDSRGVSRVYQMSLSDSIWKMWRQAPGFSQRFKGTFSEDGRTIKGRWETSIDGSNWERDFDLTYTKVK